MSITRSACIDRRVRFPRNRHLPPRGQIAAAPFPGSFPGRVQRRQISQRPSRYEGASRALRISRQPRQPFQRLVFGKDRAGGFHPAPGVDRRRADEEIDEDRCLGRRVGNEGEIARVIDRDHIRDDRIRPAPHRFIDAKPVGGDRCGRIPPATHRGCRSRPAASDPFAAVPAPARKSFWRVAPVSSVSSCMGLPSTRPVASADSPLLRFDFADSTPKRSPARPERKTPWHDAHVMPGRESVDQARRRVAGCGAGFGFVPSP